MNRPGFQLNKVYAVVCKHLQRFKKRAGPVSRGKNQGRLLFFTVCNRLPGNNYKPGIVARVCFNAFFEYGHVMYPGGFPAGQGCL